MTQDALATVIGVTPQAVSRWEAENGYPDIELLPAIADFFAVSTDELLGYKRSEREERLSEIESLCQSVINNCKNEDIRHDAITTLSGFYAKTKRTDKALEIMEQLALMKYCREFALISGVGDGKTERYIQALIRNLTDYLGYAIWQLVISEDIPNDSSTWDQKIERMCKINQLYALVYGDDLMFYHSRVSFNHWIISTYTAAQGKVEETLNIRQSLSINWSIRCWARNYFQNRVSIRTVITCWIDCRMSDMIRSADMNDLLPRSMNCANTRGDYRKTHIQFFESVRKHLIFRLFLL